MEKFIINDKAYFARELNFEYLVELDKRGIDVKHITGLAAVNCFFAFCSGMDETTAADEITKHIIKGGNLDEIIEVYGKKINDSDFFRALNKTASKATPKRNTKSKGEEVSE